MTPIYNIMINKLPLFVLITLICFSFNIYAVEKLSCEDLEDSANVLDDIADGFHAASDIIREDDPLDRALREVLDALHLIAASEGESYLSGNVYSLETAWENMNSDHFASSLEGVRDSLDHLLERDCY